MLSSRSRPLTVSARCSVIPKPSQMQTCGIQNIVSGLVTPRVDERKRISGICNVARPAGSHRGGDIVTAASADGTLESWYFIYNYVYRMLMIRFMPNRDFLHVLNLYLQVALNGVLT